MDVVGIIANIWAVLEAAEKIAQVCADYSMAVKDASWELPKVLDEVSDLAIVLKKLHKLSLSVKDGTKQSLPTLKALCDTSKGLMLRCSQEITELKQKLDPPAWAGVGTKRAALYLAASWPMKKASVERALLNLERMKSSFNLALNCDESEIIYDIQLKSQQLEDTTLEMKNVIITIQDNVDKLLDVFCQETKDSRKLRILQWLSAPDPFSNFQKAQKQCHADTGSWFLEGQKFLVWQTTPNSFIWLHGIPGCGKTVLNSTILKHVMQDSQLAFDINGTQTIVIYFFFVFNDAEKQTVDQMLRSLIFQLSTRSQEIPPTLELLFKSCLDGQRPPTTDKLEQLFRDLLRNTKAKEVVLIIDALDESTETEDLAKMLEIMHGWKLDHLHVLATSRREADIGRNLESIAKDVISIQNAAVDKDIASYIHVQLRTDTRLKKWNESLG